MRSVDRTDSIRLAAALGLIAGLTAAFRVGLHLTNPTIAALSFLLVVLLTATLSSLWAAIVASLVADLCLNYFFMPPFGTFRIADPQNWVALFVFLAVSAIASQLSSAVRARAREATARRDELGRLFDLSRDILLTTDSREAIGQLARFVARRFELEFVAIARPEAGGWVLSEGGTLTLTLDPARLTRVFADAERSLEFDARARAYSGHAVLDSAGRTVQVVPLRLGTTAVGLLACAGRPVEAGTIDAIAGLAAIAMERAKFLEERRSAEIARRNEELKSALLASLAHDLRTPLTAIRVAASNLQATWLDDAARRDQSELIGMEVERLHRLFQNILDMARIDAGAIAAERRWVHPSEIVEAARDQVEHALHDRSVQVASSSDSVVFVDPRLTASAVAHVLENAAQYGGGSPIDVGLAVGEDGLLITVRDRGPGIAPGDLAHLFDRFYRGGDAKRHAPGTGMGLAIARGMLAAEQGRIWASNCADGGAQFTIAVPAEYRAAAAEQPV